MCVCVAAYGDSNNYAYINHTLHVSVLILAGYSLEH